VLSIRAPLRCRQGLPPGQVIAQRQGSRLIVGQQGAQIAIRVIGAEQRLQRLDPGRLGNLLRVVAGLRQRAADDFQAARDIEEGRAEIAAAGRVVVDHRHQLSLRWRRVAQLDQASGLGGDSLGLARDQLRLPATVGMCGDHQRIDGAGSFRLHQVERRIGQFQAGGISFPGGDVAMPVRLGGEHRDAPLIEQRLQCARLRGQLVQHQHPRMCPAIGEREQFGQSATVELLAEHCIGKHAARCEQAQPLLQPAGFGIDEMMAMDEQRDGRQVAQMRLARLPCGQLPDIGKKAASVRVVQAALRPCPGRRQVGQESGHGGLRLLLPGAGEHEGMADVVFAAKTQVAGKTSGQVVHRRIAAGFGANPHQPLRLLCRVCGQLLAEQLFQAASRRRMWRIDPDHVGTGQRLCQSGTLLAGQRRRVVQRMIEVLNLPALFRRHPLDNGRPRRRRDVGGQPQQLPGLRHGRPAAQGGDGQRPEKTMNHADQSAAGGEASPSGT
jgi:hypothetical protein